MAREHTGLLETNERLRVETGFIKGETAWAPNLISATPTLEMGIDIGDLSTLLLSSVPPEEANYVQRMGRSGRRDGNALNMV
ncbi:helicase-related protein, partial [Rothia nasimurium]|uniref:helicase-related protein n=1 Tax=Rothia nasimurium TaxID=85336 RepID=UPI001F35EF27